MCEKWNAQSWLLQHSLGTQWEKEKWYALFDYFLEQLESDGSYMERLDALETIYQDEIPLLFKKWEEREEQLVGQWVKLMQRIAELEALLEEKNNAN